MRRDVLAVAPRWEAAASAAEGIEPGGLGAGEETLVGPYLLLRNLRLLEKSLRGIAADGVPRIPGPVKTRGDGQVVAGVFPQDLYDRLFYAGVTAEVWMEPDVSLEQLAATQAIAYQRPDAGGVALVMGGGNVTSIGPMDALYKLFVENRVVLYKTHPVNEYLGEILNESFAALIAGGFFRLVYGGAEQGAYLCAHPNVDEIHITGSDRTYEAIVFGGGPEGARRKQRDEPLLTKPISAELGNVSPVIVVPGPWSERDVAYQAENLVTMLVNNAGFNCNATRVLLLHDGWPGRAPLMAAIRRLLAALPPRLAYYPGAQARFDAFLAAHPEAERFGEATGGALPWMLIPGLDAARKDDIAYRTEAFCSVFAETPLAAPSPEAFVQRAVDFANQTLWGTLNATVIVHPRSLAAAGMAAAVERAVADLKYGTVALNHWAAVGFALGVTPWGAFPGHPRTDIQSGTGVVHNTLMFSRVQKTVLRAPFRAVPKPVWFATHRTAEALLKRLVEFEAAPSVAKLPGIFALALRG
jgi:acyl-CoA reductase-like NAD-dependent aldehyde dehydrogenase